MLKLLVSILIHNITIRNEDRINMVRIGGKLGECNPGMEISAHISTNGIVPQIK